MSAGPTAGPSAGPLSVLVVGATGMLGEAVTRRLVEDGHRVRVLVRDLDRARRQLGSAVEPVQGSVTDAAAVDRAVRGTDAVHVSLGAHSPAELEAVEHHGTADVAAAAARHGVRRLSYVTGSLVHEEYGEKIPEHRAKLAAERAIERSGVPFTFFRPTYVIDNLPRHVQGRSATVMGRQVHPLHPVAADDVAAMVSRALVTPDAANRAFTVHGPEPMLLSEALRTYCRTVLPGTRVRSMPIPLLRVIDRAFLGGRLTGPLQIMALMAQLGERGDPRPANELLGAPTTTVRAWCEARTGRVR